MSNPRLTASVCTSSNTLRTPGTDSASVLACGRDLSCLTLPVGVVRGGGVKGVALWFFAGSERSSRMALRSALDLPARCGSMPALHLPESNAESSNKVFLVAVFPVSSGLNDVKKSLAEADIFPKPFSISVERPPKAVQVLPIMD